MKEKAEGRADELPGLYSGMRVEVLTPQNRLIFIARLELLEGPQLQLTEESGQSVPWVEYNTRVKLRGFQQGGEPFSLFASVCGSAAEFWRVDRLEVLQRAEQRQFYRQLLTLPASITCVNHIFAPESGRRDLPHREIPCTILDLSGGGVRLRCGREVELAVGDWLLLSADDPLRAGARFNYTCCVRRVLAGKNSAEYGCEFASLSPAEQDRLLQTVIALQQKELRDRRRRDND